MKRRTFAYKVPPPSSRPVGRLVVYWASACPRLRDNLALRTSLWVAKRLQLPLVVLAVVSPSLLGVPGAPPSRPKRALVCAASAWSWFVNQLKKHAGPCRDVVTCVMAVCPPPPSI